MATKNKKDKTERTQLATFGAGCFWHVEEAFRKLKGIIKTEVGYEGGNMENPTYKDVHSDRIGHIEVTQIKFNPKIISYEKLLEKFWKIHDPTTPNRQGYDIGSQYNSVIFYHNAEQKKKAKKSRQDLENKGIFREKIVTEIRKAGTFWRAEDYHQEYLMKRGMDSCDI